MHLVAHSEARKASILVRERALPDAVDLVQPLRHDTGKLLTRALLRHLARKIDVALRIELCDRFIDPARYSLCSESRLCRDCEEGGGEDARAYAIRSEQRPFFHRHHIRLFSPYISFLIIIMF